MKVERRSVEDSTKLHTTMNANGARWKERLEEGLDKCEAMISEFK